MNDETKARRAVPGDEIEVLRLRDLMAATLFGPVETGPWSEQAPARLRRWLGDVDAATAAFVVEAPDGNGLAAGVIGSISERLPGPRNPSGLFGYVYGVSTDPRWQRRGFSRTAMLALLEWFGERDVRRIDLHASEFGAGLYRELGFVPSGGTAMALHR